MKASILGIGEELLAPGRVETNSVFLTDRLAELGIPVAFRAIVGDDEDAIGGATRHALEGSEIVFLTGGLGPTSDDVTREAVARALGRGLAADPDIVEEIASRFRRRGIPMPDVNRRQALVIDGATVLPNPLGTAPGQWVPVDEDRTVVLLPGPPRELEPMFRREVASRLESAGRAFAYDLRKLWVVGLPESVVEERIGPLYRGLDNPVTTILASRGQIEVRLTARADSAERARRDNDALRRAMVDVLGDAVFSESEEELEEVVGRLLASRGERLSVAESLTGGLIAERVTDVPGASRYFDYGFVTYSNEAKTDLLGVPEELFATVGAVSEEVALAMASGARERSGSDLALAVTGIAGPDGGSHDKPVGLVYVALATPQASRVERYLFPGSRALVKRFTSQAALNLLRLELSR